MEYLLAILDEVTRQQEEWRKCIKKYGANDRRTQESYYKFLGLNRAREIVVEIHDNKEYNDDYNN